MNACKRILFLFTAITCIMAEDADIFGPGGFTTNFDSILEQKYDENEGEESSRFIDSIWHLSHSFFPITYDSLLKISFKELAFLTLAPHQIWTDRNDTINLDTNNKNMQGRFVHQCIDSMTCNGYSVYYNEFPAKEMVKIIKNPTGKRSLPSGAGSGCIDRGFLIVNNAYYIRVPCGYFQMDSSFTLLFRGKKESKEFNFKIPEDVLMKSKFTHVLDKSGINKRYLELLSLFWVLERNK